MPNQVDMVILAVGPQWCGLDKGPGGTLKHSHESLVVTRDLERGKPQEPHL